MVFVKDDEDISINSSSSSNGMVFYVDCLGRARCKRAAKVSATQASIIIIIIIVWINLRMLLQRLEMGHELRMLELLFLARTAQLVAFVAHLDQMVHGRLENGQLAGLLLVAQNGYVGAQRLEQLFEVVAALTLAENVKGALLRRIVARVAHRLQARVPLGRCAVGLLLLLFRLLCGGPSSVSVSVSSSSSSSSARWQSQVKGDWLCFDHDRFVFGGRGAARAGQRGRSAWRSGRDR